MYPVYKYIGKREQCEEVDLTFPPQHQDRQPGFECHESTPNCRKPLCNLCSKIKR